MKKILIVLHDVILLTTFKIWLHNHEKSPDNIILIAHSLDAHEVLKKNKINILIMDLSVEKFDGINLLLICIKEYPKLQLVMLTDSLIYENLILPSINSLKISSSIKPLIGLLEKTLEQDLTIKMVENILIADFFQLIKINQKTCLIEIKSAENKGFIYFYLGELFNCIYDNKKGEEAFFKILDENCKIFFFRDIPNRIFPRIITTSLIKLIKAHKIQATKQDKLKASPDDKKANEEELLITEGLVELVDDNEIAIIKTVDSSKLIIEKQLSITPKKINPINSSKTEIKSLDKDNKNSEDEEVTSALNDKAEVVFQNSKLIGKEEMSLQDCLTPLQDIDGYLAAAIFDMSGEGLVQHNNSKYNVSLIGAHTVSMVNSAVKAFNGAGLGKSNFIQVNSDRGILCAVWAVEDHSVASVLLEPNANVGMAKLILAKVGEAGGSQLA